MPRESFFSVRDIFRDRRKLTIFLICVLLASLSWVLISLGKDYSTTLIVPVKYINFPENKTLLNEVPQQLAVNVNGSGYDLLQFDERLTGDTLEVNLDNLKMSVYGDYQRGYLDQSMLSNELQERLSGLLSINRVLTDSINFLFDLKVARTLPVRSRLQFDVESGYVQADSVAVFPQEVDVIGALSILDTLSFLRTEVLDVGLLNKTRTFRVPLQRVGFFSSDDIGVDSVEVQIPVDQLTEKTFLVRPSLRNVPDSLEMLVFPNSIEVKVQLGISHYDEVNAEHFSIYVDYQDLRDDYMVLPVHLEQWTTRAHQVRVEPEQVEIVLTRLE